jgi:hypothetical protein
MISYDVLRINEVLDNIFLAYFPKMKVGLLYHQSACMHVCTCMCVLCVCVRVSH